ncbi:hypothetical protein D3C71_1848860 [compost metagenome]
MIAETSASRITSTAARKSQPSAHAAPTGAGAVHGTTEITRPTRSSFIAAHASTALTIGASRNGIKNTGFITIGVPKITGSFMLKKLGTTLRRPMERRCAERLRK